MTYQNDNRSQEDENNNENQSVLDNFLNDDLFVDFVLNINDSNN